MMSIHKVCAAIYLMLTGISSTSFATPAEREALRQVPRTPADFGSIGFHQVRHDSQVLKRPLTASSSPLSSPVEQAYCTETVVRGQHPAGRESNAFHAVCIEKNIFESPPLGYERLQLSELCTAVAYSFNARIQPSFHTNQNDVQCTLSKFNDSELAFEFRLTHIQKCDTCNMWDSEDIVWQYQAELKAGAKCVLALRDSNPVWSCMFEAVKSTANHISRRQATDVNDLPPGSPATQAALLRTLNEHVNRTLGN